MLEAPPISNPSGCDDGIGVISPPLDCEVVRFSVEVQRRELAGLQKWRAMSPRGSRMRLRQARSTMLSRACGLLLLRHRRLCRSVRGGCDLGASRGRRDGDAQVLQHGRREQLVATT